MSATELRQAADTLRVRAEAATPGEWIPFGQAIGVTVNGCTCAGTAPGYPQHESYCGTDGPIVEAPEQDIAYIATMHPGVGLALATLLEETAESWDLFGAPEHVADEYSEFVYLARLINGGAA